MVLRTIHYTINKRVYECVSNQCHQLIAYWFIFSSRERNWYFRKIVGAINCTRPSYLLACASSYQTYSIFAF